MSITIGIAEAQWAELVAALDDPRETAAVLLVGTTRVDDLLLFTVNDVCWVPEDAYELRDAHRLRIASRGWMPALKRAATRTLTPVFLHTHPDGNPEPSIHDDAVDAEVQDVFRTRAGADHYISLVLGRERGRPSLSGRCYEKGGSPRRVDRVRIAGRGLRVFAAWGTSPSIDDASDSATGVFDRQIRAFGVDGQRVLKTIHAGVVGCGGTGSAVSEQLARLGVGRLSLIDHDRVTDSNVTRVYGSRMRDVGRAKVRVVAEHLEAIGLGTSIEAHEGDVTHREAMGRLRGCDVVFGCTDNHSSRAILSRFAYWYLVPLIDMGVVITSRSDSKIGVYGRVTVATPGEPCLFCRGEIDARRAAEERYSPRDLARLTQEGYAQGLDDPDPAVVAYTTMTAAYAVSDFLQRLFGIGAARLSGKLLLLITDRTVGTPAGTFRDGCYCAPQDKWGIGDRPAPLGLTWPR